MAHRVGGTRIDTASRLIGASPQAIYRVLLDPKALASWLPPRGMTGEILSFERRVGGRYRMVLTYETSQHPGPGKTSEDTDVVQGRFLELVPDERIVQSVEFVSEDSSFAGTMTMTWSLAPVGGGTEVTIRCENVPVGIQQEDHDVGLRSTLANLAAFLA
ncbi:SRPBCC family protein [Bosea sp. 2KB_26]|uniref:SRPBCC family protein n=1 Tax=Bosea sp. 2KB_26 TaxID=3237475 RepID=UPI003F91D6DC